MTNQDEDGGAPADLELSPSDKLMIRAITAADSARTGVVILRVLAVVVALAAIIGYGLLVLEFDSSGNSGESWMSPDPAVPDVRLWATFLASIATPLAFAGLLVAASYVVSVYASRLDMDLVLAAQDEPDDDGTTT